jgi:hypothetical protein
VIVLDTGGLYAALDANEALHGAHGPHRRGHTRRHAKRIMARYADLRIGLADASVVVLADRYRTVDLLCTDERHVRALGGQRGKPFRLRPLDR